MSQRVSLLVVIEALLGIVGLYYLAIAALMLLVGPVLVPASIRAHADRLGWSFWRTVITGAVFWPVLFWRQLRRGL